MDDENIVITVLRDAVPRGDGPLTVDQVRRLTWCGAVAIAIAVAGLWTQLNDWCNQADRRASRRPDARAPR
jgi:hypothetical protein